MARTPPSSERRPQASPKAVARAMRGLDRLVADPLAWRWRDGAYQDYVGGQFARAYGSGPVARDETGKPLPAAPIRTEIEPYRPQARPEDSIPAQPVGPGSANRPGDVLGLQKALSAARRYIFDIAGGERAGVYSDALRSAIEGFQAEAGAAVDGAVAPGGETAPLLRRALWPEGGLMPPRAERPQPNGEPPVGVLNRVVAARVDPATRAREIEVRPPEFKAEPTPRIRDVRLPEYKPELKFQEFPIDAAPSAVWPESPISVEFRNGIRKAEKSHSYEEFNKSSLENRIGALGLYQMTDIALRAIGMLRGPTNEPPQWTGVYGIESTEQFLKNPAVQERAFADYVPIIQRELRSKGALDKVGQTIDGIEGRIRVTEQGLIAAAHRHGAGATNRYLRVIEKNGWDSRAAKIDRMSDATFREIETRLRTFQAVSHIPGVPHSPHTSR